MAIIGGVLLGILIFLLLVFAVIIGGALGHKHEREALLRTSRDLAEGRGGDVTASGSREVPGGYTSDRHVPA